MRASLYEALGISPSATTEEVRAALRGQIRKYYAKTRDGQGNVEEALRFINHASRILSNPKARAEYDRQLALSEGSTEQRIAHVVAHAVGTSGAERTDVAAAPAVSDDREVLEQGLDVEAPDVAALEHHHPGLTERVASFGRSRFVALAICVVFAAFIAAAIVFVTPEDAVVVAKQVLVWLTVALLALTVVYAAVHGVAWILRRRGRLKAATVPDTDIAILNWRRERSVFLGTNQPQEDASWIFQLRMAELERAKTGRTSEPRPVSRLLARVFDYAFWGLVLALLLSETRGVGLVPDTLAYWLAHPLFAPVLITASWIPVEALLIASLQTTPGKWLFSCYLQFSISDAYAPRDVTAQLARGMRRGVRAWWQGVGCGFPLVAPIAAAVAYEKLNQRQETDWDAAEDCLVTHGPPRVLNVMTGGGGLGAMIWLYAVAWHQPMADTLARAQRFVTDAMIGSPALLEQGLAEGDRLWRDLRSDMAAGLIARPRESALPPGPAVTAPAAPAAVPGQARTNTATAATGSVDPELDAELRRRRARLAMLRTEGQRMLQAGNFSRASELCGAWADLDFSNPEAWRCYGEALQAQGLHQKALAALRRAKQHAPGDERIDAAIERSRQGVVGEFVQRYRQ